jgi:hypothetical protein
MPDIETLSIEQLTDPMRPAVSTLLASCCAVRISGALGHEACARYLAGVHAARSRWVEDFEGEQFTLGRAWYTHLEQGRAEEYFARAAEADGEVESFAPGLQARMLELAEAVVRAKVVPRSGWCGAAIHVFPAGKEVSTTGGVVHFDHEGLTPAQRASGAPALSLVLMIQPPERGGGLRIWDVRYDPKLDTQECGEGKESLILDYAAGDLAVFDSYRLHEIQAFWGDRARISATLHLAWAAGRWESWF